MITLLFSLLCFLLIFYLVFPFVTVLLSLIVKEKTIRKAEKQLDFACIITAYQNIDIAIPLVESLLKQAHTKQHVYLVADDCAAVAVPISSPHFTLLHPERKLGSKVRSINHALAHFVREHEAIVIFDPDNLAKPDFLSILNDYLHAGFKAVQGRRAAKNLDTIYACADATGEIYKNYVERYAPYLLGSSPTIAGSGMAVETSLFKAYLQDEKITGSLKSNRVIVAEDKILQNFLVGEKLQIAYAKNAILFDEKISTGAQVERQRSRWLYSYFENFPNTVAFIGRGLLGINRNQFLFGLITASPPLFVLLLSSFVLWLISIFISKSLFFSFSLGILVFIGNIFLVLLLSNAPKEIWKAVWGMPLFVFRQFLALLKMQRSRKDFMPTQNKKAVSIDEVMRENSEG